MSHNKTLFIFDFDDTLVKTSSRIWVTPLGGDEFSLTPAQYSIYKSGRNDAYDFREFDQLINPVEMPKYVNLLRSVIRCGHPASIVTARGKSSVVIQFLEQIGLDRGVTVVALGSSDPTKKSDYIEEQLLFGYTNVVMYDDSQINIAEFKKLAQKYPEVYFHGHTVPSYD